MDILEQVRAFLSNPILDVSIGRMIIAFLIFLGFYLFRQVFLKIGLGFIMKLTSKTKTTLDDQILDIIKPPVRFIVVVFGVWVAFNYLLTPGDALNLLNHVIRSLIIYSLFWAIFRATNIISEFFKKLTLKTSTDIDDQLIYFISKFLRVAVIALGAMIIIREWGYDVSGLIAGLGLGGLAVALAAKDTVSNLFGSLTIMLDKPFKIGDWIETPSIEGTVEDIHLRCTRIRTFANALVSVPNSILVNTPVTNWSLMKKRRIKYNIGVTYSATSKQIEKCVKELKEMLNNHPDIHPDTIFVYFNEFGESSFDIFMYFFTITTNWKKYLEVRQDVNLKIMKIIEDNGMSFAFPSRSIYMEKVNSGKNASDI